MIDYFSNIFSSSELTGVHESCDVVKNRLTDKHVEWCNLPFSGEDINEAIMQMHLLKAPGPGDLPTILFQKYWHILEAM
jgi:hypothetical protein